MSQRSEIAMITALWTAASLTLAAGLGCGGTKTAPSPATPGGTITGSERLGWTQPAATLAEAQSYTYGAYVDGKMAKLPDATCTTAVAGGFDCSSSLPALSPGTHVLELVAIDASGVEGGRAQPLSVTVSGG